MDCKLANEYANSLLFSINDENKFDEKQYLDFNCHLENCFDCSEKWKLDEKLIQKIGEKYNGISASDLLIQKINQDIEKEVVQTYNKKLNVILAACFVALVGLGVADSLVFKLPNALEIHSLTDYHLVSNEIDALLEHTQIPLLKTHFDDLEKADYKAHGSFKFNKLYKKASSIALKNTKGQKLTICLYPKNYRLPHREIIHVDGMQVYHGSTDMHNFAYWQKDNMTLVLISDSILPGELAQLASPLID